MAGLMEWGLTTKLTKWVVMLGYLSGKPYRWDPNNERLRPVPDIWGKIYWISTFVGFTILRIWFICETVRAGVLGHLQLSKMEHIFQVFWCTTFILTTGHATHAIVKRRELIILLNAELDYFEAFLGKYIIMLQI